MTEDADHDIRPAHSLLDRDPIEYVARHDRQAIGGLGDRLGTPGQDPHCVSGVERLGENHPAGAAGRSEQGDGQGGHELC